MKMEMQLELEFRNLLARVMQLNGQSSINLDRRLSLVKAN